MKVFDLFFEGFVLFLHYVFFTIKLKYAFQLPNLIFLYNRLFQSPNLLLLLPLLRRSFLPFCSFCQLFQLLKLLLQYFKCSPIHYRFFRTHRVIKHFLVHFDCFSKFRPHVLLFLIWFTFYHDIVMVLIM